MDTPLHIAAHHNDLVAIRTIFANQGAWREPHKPGTNNATPLHWAAGCGHADAVTLLLQNGADVNAKNIFGRTPLDNAALHGHIAVVRLLLRKSTNQKLKNKNNLP